MAEIQRRQIKESFGSRAFDVVNIIILALLSLVCLYPVWYVLVASVSDGNLLMQHTGRTVKASWIQSWSIQKGIPESYDYAGISEYT